MRGSLWQERTLIKWIHIREFSIHKLWQGGSSERLGLGNIQYSKYQNVFYKLLTHLSIDSFHSSTSVSWAEEAATQWTKSTAVIIHWLWVRTSIQHYDLKLHSWQIILGYGLGYALNDYIHGGKKKSLLYGKVSFCMICTHHWLRLKQRNINRWRRDRQTEGWTLDTQDVSCHMVWSCIIGQRARSDLRRISPWRRPTLQMALVQQVVP